MVGDRLEVEHAVARLVAGQHAGLGVGVGVAERQAHHEAVQLRLRQRVGALVLDRVLGREDHERARELVREDVDGDVALLLKLFLNQESYHSLARRKKPGDGVHGGVFAMAGAKGVVHIKVGQGTQLGRKRRVGLLFAGRNGGFRAEALVLLGVPTRAWRCSAPRLR